MLVDGGSNLSSDATCGLTNGNNTVLDLGVFDLLGGYIPTFELVAGSPAIDAAAAIVPNDLADADGDSVVAEPVPFDGRGNGYLRQIGSARDIGAFEFNPDGISLVVDRLDDVPAGACTDAPNDCTLRGAMETAERIGGADTITFDVTGTIQMDMASPFYFERDYAGMVVTEDLVIEGPGADLLTINGDDYRLTEDFVQFILADNSLFATGVDFFATSTGSRGKPHGGFPSEFAFDLEVRGLTINGTNDFDGGAFDIFGSPFVSSPVGEVVSEPENIGVLLQDLRLTNNQALSGGALFAAFAAPVTIDGVEFSGNSAITPSVLLESVVEVLTDRDFSLSQRFNELKNRNMFKPAGGGFGFGLEPGMGGAIFYVGSQIVIFDSLFENNTAGRLGGAIGYIGYIGDEFALGRDVPDTSDFFIGLAVYNSTFVDNNTFNTDEPVLGIFIGGFDLPIGAGGAIYSAGFTIIGSSTFAGNDAEEGSSIYLVPIGGVSPVGVSIVQGAYFNTLFLDDSDDVDNCTFELGVSALASTVLDDDDTCGDQATAAVLDPAGLQDNGGATRTIAILPGSEAVDSGDSTSGIIAPDLFDVDGDTNVDEDHPFDQRGAGFARIVNSALDIGAFELQDAVGATVFISPDPVEVTEGATIGDLICVTIDPEPASDVTLRVQLAASADARLNLVDPSTPAVSASFFDVFFDISAVDTTICNPDQLIGVQAVFGTSDADGVDLLGDAIEVLEGALTLTTADVNIYDPGVTVTEPTPNPVQEGSNTQYTVVLNGPPGVRNAAGEYETVTVELRGFNTRLLSAADTAFVFSRDDWDIPQIVEVGAIDDPLDRGVRYIVSIQHQSLSNIVSPFDSRYGGAAPNLSSVRARVTIADNDFRDGSAQPQTVYDALNLAAWLDLNPTGAVALEGADAFVLNVRIAGQPLDGEAVVIDLSSIAGVTVSPATLTFTAHNWDIYQPVQVTVAPDADLQGLRDLPLQAVISAGSTALDFVGAADAVQFSVTDDPNAVPVVPGLPEQPVVPFAPGTEGSSSAEGSTTEKR